MAAYVQISKDVPGDGVFAVVSSHPALALDALNCSPQLLVGRSRPEQVVLLRWIFKGRRRDKDPVVGALESLLPKERLALSLNALSACHNGTFDAVRVN